MPLSIGIVAWSDLDRDVFTAIQEHARVKSALPINWTQWLQQDDTNFNKYGGIDVPYSEGLVVNDVLETFCGSGIFTSHDIIIVPYHFDYHLSLDFPPPRDFWFDILHVSDRSITVIDGVWMHTVWRGWVDKGYQENAQRYASLFNQKYDENNATQDIYDYAYHYIEISLMNLLDKTIDGGYVVRIS